MPAIAGAIALTIALTIVLAISLAMTSCATPPPPAEVTARVDQDTARVADKIALACLGSGLFKRADGAVAKSVPSVALGVDALNAGVDVVCSRPELFAADVSSIEWLTRNLRDEVARRHQQN